ncbi:MAG: hypothetical protein JJE18_09915 [Eubacteriaceae bacterium]|nr:hypothetical protein [Eubacteriaceae bacterium]
MFDFKDILRILISFLLGIVLIFFQTVLFVDLVLLNPVSYLEYANTPAYYDKLRVQIDFGLEEVGRFTNLPGDLITQSVSDVEIKDYTQTAISEMIGFLRGDIKDYTLKFDTSTINKNLEGYVKDYVVQRNLPYTEEQAAQVQKISKMSGERIETYSMIIDPGLLKQVGVDKALQNVLSKIHLAEFFLGGLILLMVFLLWLTNKHHRMRTLWWTGSSLLVSSIVLLIPGITVMFMNVAGRIGLKDNYVTWVLERTINSSITKWNFTQLSFLALGILLMAGYLSYRHKQKKSSKRYH